MKFPVIGQINTFRDVKDALDAIRSYFTSRDVQIGNVTVTQPANGATLTIKDGQLLQVDQKWELQNLETGLSGQTVNATKCVTVKINGAHIKLAVLN